MTTRSVIEANKGVWPGMEALAKTLSCLGFNLPHCRQTSHMIAPGQIEAPRRFPYLNRKEQRNGMLQEISALTEAPLLNIMFQPLPLPSACKPLISEPCTQIPLTPPLFPWMPCPGKAPAPLVSQRSILGTRALSVSSYPKATAMTRPDPTARRETRQSQYPSTKDRV